MNKKYRVIIHFEGAMDYEIEASNEDEAKEKAKTMFAEEDDRIIISEIADSFICDVWEEI